jgi:hypothetical protein
VSEALCDACDRSAIDSVTGRIAGEDDGSCDEAMERNRLLGMQRAVKSQMVVGRRAFVLLCGWV